MQPEACHDRDLDSALRAAWDAADKPEAWRLMVQLETERSGYVGVGDPGRDRPNVIVIGIRDGCPDLAPEIIERAIKQARVFFPQEGNDAA
jgi:hypothetical protein